MIATLKSKFSENRVLDNYHVLELEVKVSGSDNDTFVLSLSHDQQAMMTIFYNCFLFCF